MFKFNFFSLKKPKSSPVVDENFLFGHDLRKWTYLGNSRLTISDGDKVIANGYVALFAEKGNEENGKRSYQKLTNGFDYYYHSWMTSYLPLWLNKEKPEVYIMVNYMPSQWLKKYMRDEYNHVWDRDEVWWVKNEQVKYDVAVEKQKEKEKKPDIKVVEFKKPS